MIFSVIDNCIPQYWFVGANAQEAEGSTLINFYRTSKKWRMRKEKLKITKANVRFPLITFSTIDAML